MMPPLPHPPQTARTRLHWSLYFLTWTLGLTALGALLGLVLFPLVGWGVGLNRTPGDLALAGIRILGFYFGIWAPGIALVVTVKREYEARRAIRTKVSLKSENPADR
jgi:Zn-dependent protease with chaperone function